jgi:N-acetylglucosaminyldiphosphoundecaprenol N-acetyl-beta-D-mannosaminyltransferase
MIPDTQIAPSIRILGTNVHMARIDDVISIMANWIDAEPNQLHHVVNTGMHGIMAAHRDPAMSTILNSVDLLAPDGILAISIARLHGYRLKKQDTGPDLLWRFSETANHKGYSYFLFGDSEDTLDLLSSKLAAVFPDLRIAGVNSPPYREWTDEEDAAMVAEINLAKPDVLWVGLGMPKQEQWIFEHRDALNVPVVVGAGAAFKFLSGTVPRAPKLVCNLGFEWLWRLAQEPRRVWRRVVIDAPQFIALVFLQFIGLKKFQ